MVDSVSNPYNSLYMWLLGNESPKETTKNEYDRHRYYVVAILIWDYFPWPFIWIVYI